MNPPELGLMEKLMPRVKRGRYVLHPHARPRRAATARTRCRRCGSRTWRRSWPTLGDAPPRPRRSKPSELEAHRAAAGGRHRRARPRDLRRAGGRRLRRGRGRGRGAHQGRRDGLLPQRRARLPRPADRRGRQATSSATPRSSTRARSAAASRTARRRLNRVRYVRVYARRGGPLAGGGADGGAAAGKPALIASIRSASGDGGDSRARAGNLRGQRCAAGPMDYGFNAMRPCSYPRSRMSLNCPSPRCGSGRSRPSAVAAEGPSDQARVVPDRLE